MTRLAVVIPTFRVPDQVADCLVSLDAEVDPERDMVVVVDNGSDAATVAKIRDALRRHDWRGSARLIELPVNLGFAGAVNAALRAVESESYLLLNSDVTVRPGAIESLRAAADDRPDAGIIGARLESPDGTPQTARFRDPSALGELVWAAGTAPVTKILARHVVALPAVDHPTEPDWVSFACVLIRRRVIEDIGPLDERFFMYFDDADFCRRARAGGWHVLHWPAARVVHHRYAAGAMRPEDVTRADHPRSYWVSRARFFAKHHGRAALWLANSLWLVGRAVSLSRETLGRKAPHTAPAEARLIWTNWRDPLGERGRRPPAREGRP